LNSAEEEIAICLGKGIHEFFQEMQKNKNFRKKCFLLAQPVLMILKAG
jgi:hypothetical protein